MYSAYVILFSIMLNNTKVTKIIIPIFFIIAILGHVIVILSHNFNLIKWSLAAIAFVRTAVYTLIIDIFANYFDQEVFRMSTVSANMSFGIYGLLYPIISVMVNGDYILLNSMDATVLTLGFLLFITNIIQMQP